METSLQDFIASLHQDDETEYGDFKRELDSQIRRWVENSPPMTEQQVRAILKLREDYLWTDHPDEEIEGIKREVEKRISEIMQMSPH
ncbi:MAG: hypothetical protein ACXWRE_16490 [Pseudobdellovibrionaceae bacterium]